MAAVKHASAPQTLARVRSSAPLEWCFATTRAIFYVLGITQPSPQQERTVSLTFWASVLAIALFCLAGMVAVIGSVSLLK